jgi:ComF family protein
MRIKEFLDKFFFNRKWKCLSCGREIFEGNFCADCEKILPYNNGYICNHCGRKVIAPEEYCLTCKGVITSIDKARSTFSYDKPISAIIKRLKYFNRKYVADAFAEYLFKTYLDNDFSADLIVFIPMTESAKKKRGFNQAELLANALSNKTGVPVVPALTKIKETISQVKLDRSKRLKNLTDAFHVKERKAVKDRKVLIVDDVSTTGATAEAAANKLKRAGAKTVYLLTVASVPPINGY